ncbi:MAG: zinc-ribbon domain-containing protein [Clostridium sp.]|nr:zinc-ribbon domain-containing protein [Clostridium sp.]
MKQRLIRFMQGRYGMDQLGRALFWATMICLIISIFVRTKLFYFLALVLLVYSYFRMLSRNHAKRYAENQRYLALTAGIRRKFSSWKKTNAQRKTHHIYRCPNCKQKIRVPRGKGRIAITCPKCRTEFIKNS